jgi:hypothetical protein
MTSITTGGTIIGGSGADAAAGVRGAEHATVVREELFAERLEDEDFHLRRYTGDLEDAGIPV